jgi:hypothetical protein
LEPVISRIVGARYFKNCWSPFRGQLESAEGLHRSSINHAIASEMYWLDW